MAEVKEINFNRMYKVKNLCPWDLGIGENGMSLHFPVNVISTVSGQNIDILIANGNKFLCGTGEGNHAKLEIMDDDVKKYYGFEKQKILTKDAIKKIFEYATDSTFEKHIEEDVIASHEKEALYDYIVETNFEGLSAKRLKFIEKYLGREF